VCAPYGLASHLRARLATCDHLRTGDSQVVASASHISICPLTSTRSFAGRVGMNDIELTFDNGPVIRGRLNMPIESPTGVSGSVDWTAN